MRDHRPTSTGDLLAQSKLKTIQEHAEQIHQLTSLIRSVLPKGTEDFIRVANIRNNYLHLQAASAAIKMKVSYERLTILNFLRANGYAGLMGLDITIEPSIYRSDQTEKAPEKTAKAPVSENAANMLKSIATNATPKVRARLENIAKLADKNKKTGE
ncbi:DUF721 domain-containing protein [Vibrio salinus]|uniref:DUF721 domain-containing protein n=1 Tax=Vibrio salinus TaxID=2899784 RepID=UPI001E4D0306|nr:DciA family protein [Vibrio salinus]MCE0494260.1 DciA family protein [Vibrio salinus]